MENKSKCTKCKEFKLKSDFDKRKDTKKGHKSWCKDCICIKKHGRKYLGKNGDFCSKATEFPNGTKLCTICNKIKTLDEFKNKDKRKNKLLSYCQRCQSLKLKAKTYNISIETIEKMLHEQNGLCKICNLPQYDGRDLYIDHDHNTGKVRALLCNHCNTGLGKFREDVQIMEKAIDYLKYHKE